MTQKTDTRIQPEMHFFPSLEPVLSDPTVIEILIDGFNQIYVERQGRLEDVPSPYRDNEHLMAEIREVAAALGRRVDESHPIVDLRLWDGSRIHVVIPPIALRGPSVTMRKVVVKPWTAEDLLSFGSWNEDMLTFLRACVLGRINIAVAGGTGSGKTTMLNILCGMIPDEERIITIEAASSLRFNKRRLVALEARPPNLEGRGEISLTDLVISAMKMRPDRIILNEAQGGEVLHFLQAMNTGFDGSLCNLHANNPRDALARLEVMATMGNPAVPLLSVREQMASAVDLIIHQERLRDGRRRVMKVTEVVGLQGDVIQVQDIFEFRQTAYEEGEIKGHFTATGLIPRFISKLRNSNVEVPMTLFAPR